MNFFFFRSPIMFSPDQIAILAAALAQGSVEEPAVQQQQAYQPRARSKNSALYNHEPDPASLGISLLAAAADEIQEERPTQRASRSAPSHGALPTGDSLDEIANHILSTFPEVGPPQARGRSHCALPKEQ